MLSILIFLLCRSPCMVNNLESLPGKRRGRWEHQYFNELQKKNVHTIAYYNKQCVENTFCVIYCCITTDTLVILSLWKAR